MAIFTSCLSGIEEIKLVLPVCVWDLTCEVCRLVCTTIIRNLSEERRLSPNITIQVGTQEVLQCTDVFIISITCKVFKGIYGIFFFKKMDIVNVWSNILENSITLLPVSWRWRSVMEDTPATPWRVTQVFLASAKFIRHGWSWSSDSVHRWIARSYISKQKECKIRI